MAQAHASTSDLLGSEMSAVPRHLGLILDGNRRWAREHGLPTLEGHRQGYENLKIICETAFKAGVEYISAYVFSTENWKRGDDEVNYLMKLITWAAKHEVGGLDRQGVRLQVIGARRGLPAALRKAIDSAEHTTAHNQKKTILLCINYGGQQEIVDAVQRIIVAGIPATAITSELIGQYLYAPDVPSLDLIIRTSGEQRLSNFMLWESAYSELLFTHTYWPEFRSDELQAMLLQYGQRQRRLGR